MSLLNRRRVLLSAKGKVLPYAYQQVEWLESTGTQWIDTKFYGNQKSRITASIQSVSYDSGKWNVWIGALKTTAEGNWVHLGQASRNRGVRFAWGIIGTVYTNIAYDDFSKHYYDMDRGTLTIDNQNSYSLSNSAFTTEPTPIVLFADNKANNIIEHSKIRIFDCKMYDNDILVRDFIPCYRKADGKTGMYDIVNNKFCPNSGTGEFILGGEV